MERVNHHSRNSKFRVLLHQHRKRTGVGLAPLLAGRNDAPDGFNSEEMERFYCGSVKRVRRDYGEYVIRLWSALPDAHRAPRKHERIDITPELRAELRAEWLRVGLSVDALFKRFANPPSRLSAGIIRRWIGDHPPRRVRKDHWEFVLCAWKQLPDGMGRLRRIHFIPFTHAATEV